MAKISIAIPTWESYNNGEQFLDDLLRTIEIQTFKDFEVVISDHSKDDYLLSKIKEFEDSLISNIIGMKMIGEMVLPT